ncbi:MAG: calcium-binding protein [Nocardioides sp.]
MRIPVHQLAALGLLAPALLTLGYAPALANSTAPMCHGHVATIVGTASRDTIVGTPGDDVIVGGKGGDHIDGGPGHDVICGGNGRDSLVGGSGNDVLRGQYGDDTLAGGEGNDFVHGGEGEDTLAGGSGNDRLAGGSGLVNRFAADAGDDTWVSTSKRDQFQFMDAPGPISLDLAAGTVTGWGHDTFRLSQDASVTVVGTPYDDTLLGGPGADTLLGEGGVDTIAGRSGPDLLVSDRAVTPHETAIDTSAALIEGGPGDDEILIGPAGTASGGPGDDHVDVNFSADLPLSGDLSLSGGDGRDRLLLWDATPVGPGVNVDGVYQQVDFDMVTGNLDADDAHFTFPSFEDFIFETRDWHTVSTDWAITGTDGPNDIFISSLDRYGSSTVVEHGASGDDRLQSGGGDDTLYGGPGSDEAAAQNGYDTCISIEGSIAGGSNGCEVMEP